MNSSLGNVRHFQSKSACAKSITKTKVHPGRAARTEIHLVTGPERTMRNKYNENKSQNQQHTYNQQHQSFCIVRRVARKTFRHKFCASLSAVFVINSARKCNIGKRTFLLVCAPSRSRYSYAPSSLPMSRDTTYTPFLVTNLPVFTNWSRSPRMS